MEINGVLALNVNSIRSLDRKTQLELFIRTNKSKIVFLSETHLKSTNAFYLSGFKIFKQCRESGNGGGTAILLCEGIKFRNFKVYSNNFEASSVDVFLNGKWMRLISMYIPPRSRLSVSDFRPLFNVEIPVILGGDLNARHVSFGDISSNQIGMILHDFLSESGIIRMGTNIPTYGNISFIDAFLISPNLCSSDSLVSTIPNTLSDHLAIQISIKLHSESEFRSRELLAFNFTEVDRLNRYIETEFGDLIIPTNRSVSDEHLETISKSIENIFKNAIDKFVPRTKLPSNLICLSKHSLLLNKAYRNSSRKFYRNKFSPFADVLKDEMKHFRTMLRNSIRFDINNYFRNGLVDITHHRKLYDTIRMCSAYKPYESPTQHSIRGDNGLVLRNPAEINEALAERFASNHMHTIDYVSNVDQGVFNSVNDVETPVNGIIFSDLLSPEIIHENDLNNTNNLLSPNQRNILTCSDEIQSIINSRLNKKSAGIDRMPICLIKQFCPNIILFLTIFFNHLLANGYFPKTWRRANVIPIPKANGDKNSLGSWRPISQLNSLSKIFEKIIYVRLLKFARSEKLIPDFQFGFRNDRNTLQPLALLNNSIANNLNNGRITTVCLLDIQSAFDTVWHDGLIFKLKNFGFRSILVRMIRSFLSERTFTIGSAEEVSNVKFAPAGSPQGSVLSPLLWNLFISDIPRHNRIKMLQFADDTIVYMGHTAPFFCQYLFNDYLRDLFLWFKNWKLKLNESKTELIHFVGKRNEVKRKFKNIIKLTEFKINNVKLEPVPKIKYLGVVFNNRFNFNGHIEHVIKRTHIRSGQLNKFLCSALIQPHIKTHIYKQFLRPIIQYACPIWLNNSTISSHQIEKLRLLERKIIRRTSNTYRKRHSYRYVNNSELYFNANIKRIDVHLSLLSIKFHDRCKGSAIYSVRNIVETLNENAIYKPTSQIFSLNESANLFSNDQLLLFHKAKYRDTLVYNVNQ